MNPKPDYKCKCGLVKKSWKGDDRKCAFNHKEFNSDNWNCVTMNILRDICDYIVWSNDQNASLIPVEGIDHFTHLFLGWYKNRGRTEQAFLISDRSIKQLTLEDAFHIIENYESKN